VDVAEGGNKIKSALRDGFVPAQDDKPDDKEDYESSSGGGKHGLQQRCWSFPKNEQREPVGKPESAIKQ
jgi:hypothetical protein